MELRSLTVEEIQRRIAEIEEENNLIKNSPPHIQHIKNGYKSGFEDGLLEVLELIKEGKNETHNNIPDR